ncbi:MAG: AAA family ATPase [Lachnospiraceae bacterium]|nr:AAA family ATPase [Lachnospiraceae bacterium]
MYRKFMEQLLSWEQNKTKEPLLITGARQVGKTWIIKEFCKEAYSDYAYINFEEREDFASAFEGSLTPKDILRTLGILLDRKISETTAIFFDEIQLCERAITSLKYFCEAEENYRVICAGSLLGVKLKRFEGSFPVGKVIIKHMYPLDFEEFLIATGDEDLKNMIYEHYLSLAPLPNGIHSKAINKYHDYLFVGGMPKIVETYALTKDVMNVPSEMFENLRTAYLADMSKHVKNAPESLKISEVYNSIPRQLANENPKFKYKEVKNNANKRDYLSAIDWLDAAGMVIKIDNVEMIASPLKGYENTDSFKLYISDPGLLSNLCHLRMSDIISSEHNIYKGSVIENYVISQFTVSGKSFYYFKPSENMEIDVVLDEDDGIIPCEIKSGRHKRSKSLNNYIEKYNPVRAYRLSELNFGQAQNLISIPLYAAFCI